MSVWIANKETRSGFRSMNRLTMKNVVTSTLDTSSNDTERTVFELIAAVIRT